jgi:hypothetical protein
MHSPRGARLFLLADMDLHGILPDWMPQKKKRAACPGERELVAGWYRIAVGAKGSALLRKQSCEPAWSKQYLK